MTQIVANQKYVSNLERESENVLTRVVKYNAVPTHCA